MLVHLVDIQGKKREKIPKREKGGQRGASIEKTRNREKTKGYSTQELEKKGKKYKLRKKIVI